MNKKKLIAVTGQTSLRVKELESEDLLKFIKSLPFDDRLKPRIRTGSQIKVLHPHAEVRAKGKYMVEPQQLNIEKHHRNIQIIALRNPELPFSQIKAMYKKAALADYNKGSLKLD